MRYISVHLALALFFSASTLAIHAASENEKSRIFHIAQDGMAEVKLGKLAEEKAKNSDVKKFAKHMVEDHSQANQELMSAAKSAGFELPDDCSAEQTATYEHLKKLDAIEFDKNYTTEMVKGHAKAVEAIGQESKEGTGVLKEWATKTLPTIKAHKKEADALHTKVQKAS